MKAWEASLPQFYQSNPYKSAIQLQFCMDNSIIKTMRRTIEPMLQDLSQHFRVLLLTGMRQVGKTTVLKGLCEQDRSYVTLDNQADLQLARSEPRLFFQTYKPPVLIDEIQYAPELFPVIKEIVDTRQERGLIWLAGSQQFHLVRNIQESLAGRVVICNLMGFSLAEQCDRALSSIPFIPRLETPAAPVRRDLGETFKIIWQGSFPEGVQLGEKYWKNYYSSYVKTYLDRDVRDLITVRDQLQFHTFLKIIASRTGQELNMADIARDCGIAQNTAKAWLSVLESSGIIFLLPPFSANISKRVTKRPKLYFLDTGLCSFLTDWLSSESLASGAMRGAIFETFVVAEILKSYLHNGIEPQLYYYRDNNGREIDLIISQDNILYPVEIKVTASPNLAMTKNFTVLQQTKQPRGTGALICLTDKPRPLSQDIIALSLWDI